MKKLQNSSDLELINQSINKIKYGGIFLLLISLSVYGNMATRRITGKKELHKRFQVILA
jgi:hypothetical protein